MPRMSPPRKDKNNVPRQKRELPAAVKKEAERVAKVIARAGLASRRDIEAWIAEGRVAVNGTVLTSPAVTVTAADAITVDGAPLPEKERTRLFLYHKPRGVVTTNRDPEGRTTLFEILPGGLPRLVSVGRLDLNSEGLLLLTNDGGLARALELPETGWLRRYRVRANGEIDQARLDSLLKGITVDGVEYGPIEAELDRVQGANAWITVSLREGKNREVRNVLGALGLKVNRLIRISYGPFQLGEIPEGEIEEVRTRVLKDQIGAELSAVAGADFEGPILEHEIEPAPPRPAAPAARRGKGDNDAPAQDEFRPAGPRVRRRIAKVGALETRGTVADKRGRAVKVERLVTKPRDDADRPARGDRGTGRDQERDFGRGPRRFADDERRPQRGFRPRDGEEEGRGPRRGRPGEDRPRGPRTEGGPRRFERNDDRPQRSFRPREGEEEFRGPGRGRPGGDRPRGPRTEGGPRRFERNEDRPQRSFRPREGEEEARGRGRPGGDKPRGPRNEGGPRRFERNDDRPQRSFRPREGEEDFRGPGRGRPGGGRPGGDRPRGPRPDGGAGDRAPRGEGPGRERSGGFKGARPAGKGGFKGGFGGKPGGRPTGKGGGKPGGRPGGRPSAPRGKR